MLGCSGGRSPGLELTSLLVDENVLIDAGGAASSLPLDQQEQITDVVVTHAHLDHILGIALIFDNTRHSRSRPLTIHATEPVIRNIREHLLVPSIYPGAHRGEADPPGLHFHAVALEIPFRVGTIEFEALPVNHSTGAVALRFSDLGLTAFFTGDTGPTDRIWEWLRKNGKIDCLLAEVSFPDRMAELAKISGHLTPSSLIESLKKAEAHPDRKVHLVHLKPAFMGELLDEIEAPQPVEALWGAVTAADVRIEGGVATLTQNGKSMRVRILQAPEGAKWEVVSTQPPAPQRRNEGARKLVVRLPEKVSKAVFEVAFEPVRP